MSIAEILDTMDYGPAPESEKPAREWIAKHAEALEATRARGTTPWEAAASCTTSMRSGVP